MTNFVLQYPLLEDKSDRPYECEWCGDNFGGHKRKYCTPKCREEERRYDAYKEKQERYKKREIKKVEREKEKQEKRIAKLDKELEGLLLDSDEKTKNDKVWVSMSSFPDLAMTSARLLREVTVQSKLLEILVPQYEQARMEENKNVPTLQILDEPKIPLNKSKP